MANFAKVCDGLPLIGEEAFEQVGQGFRVAHLGAGDFSLVLDENGGCRVFVDNVVARIALGGLLADFLVEIVVRVLGFPIAEGNPDRVNECTVDIAAVAGRRDVLVFRKEDQVAALAPPFEQVLERFPYDAFTLAAGGRVETVELTAIFGD